MSDSLKNHISKYITLNTADFTGVRKYFNELTVKKKENILVEGKICSANYFVEKGCLRLFFISEKGVEQTTQFAIENWWLADYASFANQQSSGFYIQAVENSRLLAIDFLAQEKMLKEFPVMERYFRLIHQRAHAASQFRIKNLYELSREALFYQFKQRYPEFVERIPQYLLASFLGFTPEYLSEIKNKKVS